MPTSTGLPAYMTMTSSATPATTPMSWVIMMTPAPVSCWATSMTSRICAWIVTSSAVVGSSAMSTRGLVAIAWAMTTRWRRPPENSWGKALTRRWGLGMPTRSSSSTARSQAALELRALSWAWSASTICVPTSKTGVRAERGSWKIIPRSLPRNSDISASPLPRSSSSPSRTEPVIFA